MAFDSAAIAHAIWIEEGEDGTRDVTQIDLRENTDSDTGATIGTSITISNFVDDANGNTLASAFGAFFTADDVYDFTSNLNSAKLLPVQVPMLVCDL